MTYSIRSRPFLFGFFLAVLIFSSVNIIVYLGPCYHCVENIGFPIVFRQRYEGSMDFSSGSLTFPDAFDIFSLWRLIANILIVLLSSVGFGTIIDLVIARLRSAA